MRLLAWSLVVAACGARSELATYSAGDASPSIEAGFDASFDAPDTSPADATAPPDAPPTSCAPGITKLTTLSEPSDALAVDDDYAYYHVKAGVRRVPKTGGASTLVAATQSLGSPDFTAFFLGPTDIYWENLTQSALQIMATPKAGGSAVILASEPSLNAYYPGAGSTFFVWSANDYKLSLFTPPSTTTFVGSIPVYTDQVVQDGPNVYVASEGGVWYLDGAAQIHHVAQGPLGQGATLTFAAFLAIDASAVYFLSITDMHVIDIISAPKLGGAATVLAENTQQDIGPLILDGTNLYFTERNAGKVERMGIDASNRIVLALANIGVNGGLAVDDHCLYWNTPDGVYATPK